MVNQATLHISSVPVGKTATIIKEVTQAAGQTNRTFSTDADAILFSLFVTTLSGTLDVSIYTFSEDGKELLVATFPQILASTSALVLKKATDYLSNLEVRVTYTGAAEYEVRARGLNSGESSVKISGADSAQTSTAVVTNVTGVLIPTSLADRNGLCLRNWAGGATMFIGFTPLEATVSDGYPIAFREQFAMDLAAGVTLYAVSDGGNIDVRIIEGGQ